jgi:hypothetical protein
VTLGFDSCILGNFANFLYVGSCGSRTEKEMSSQIYTCVEFCI